MDTKIWNWEYISWYIHYCSKVDKFFAINLRTAFGFAETPHPERTARYLPATVCHCVMIYDGRNCAVSHVLRNFQFAAPSGPRGDEFLRPPAGPRCCAPLKSNWTTCVSSPWQPLKQEPARNLHTKARQNRALSGSELLASCARLSFGNCTIKHDFK